MRGGLRSGCLVVGVAWRRQADEHGGRRAQHGHADGGERRQHQADRRAEHGGDQAPTVTQVRRDHRHVAGRKGRVEPERLGIDRRPDERADQRRHVPAGIDRQAGGPEGVAAGDRTILRRGHRRALVDRQLGGDEPPSERPADHARHRQPVHRVAGRQDRCPAERGRGGTAGSDHADGAELRRAREHQQRHHARLQHRSADRHEADAEHHAEQPDGAGERQRRGGDLAALGRGERVGRPAHRCVVTRARGATRGPRHRRR